MTGQVRASSQNCIETISDIKTEKFPDESDDVPDEDLYVSTFTSIWKNPERLSNESDQSLLLAALSREIHMENYNQALRICKIMKKLEPENREIDRIFIFLMMQILKEEKHKKIEPHIVLEWLFTGDRLFYSEIITKESYAFLKFYFLCRNRDFKYEIFSCGCIQKQFIEFYTEDSSKRLMGAINALIRSSSSKLHPIPQRLFNAMPQFSPLDYFECYVELVDELQMCSVIDKFDEEQSMRLLVQLIGILCELRLEDVPKACSKLNKLIVTKNDSKKKLSSIEIALRRLLPKIFDSISSISSVKIQLTMSSVPKMVELVTNEKYSNADQAYVLFPPLQILNKLHSDFDVWEKSWSIIKPRLNALKMSSSQSPIVILYVLSLVYRNDATLVSHLVEYLEKQYQEGTIGVKKTILILLEIMEKLENPTIQSFFKENRIRNRLILDSELDISIQYLPDFTNSELNQFLEKKSFSDEQFSILVDKLSGFEKISIISNSFWSSLLEKMNENSMNFVENQLKLLINRLDRRWLNLRIEQIFKKIKEMKIDESAPLLLRFSSFLLNLLDSEYGILPPSTTISLVSVLVMLFCASYETKQSEINELFGKLHSKINKNSSGSIKNPIEIFEDVCDKIKSKTIQGSLDFVFLKDVYELKPEIGSRSERIVVISSILFQKLASELQKLGDKTGRTQYCIILTIIDSYVNKMMKMELIPNFEKFQKICERVMEGFTMYQEKIWNWLFISRKITTILLAAKKDQELLKKLMRISNKNKDLHTKLSTNKEFLQLEQSLQ